MNSEEVLSVDWLEDDMNESVSEQRYSNDNSISTMKRKSSNNDIDREKNSKRQKRVDESPAMKENEIDLTEEESNGSCDTEIQSFNQRRSHKRKQQMSLLSVGFTKDSDSRTPSPANPFTVEYEPQEVAAAIKSVILNVSVEDKVFKTQVELSSVTKHRCKKL